MYVQAESRVARRSASCEAHIDHVQKQVLLGDRLAPVMRTHRDHNRIAISVPRVGILHSAPASVPAPCSTVLAEWLQPGNERCTAAIAQAKLRWPRNSCAFLRSVLKSCRAGAMAPPSKCTSVVHGGLQALTT